RISLASRNSLSESISYPLHNIPISSQFRLEYRALTIPLTIPLTILEVLLGDFRVYRSDLGFHCSSDQI
ncbi:hypothetical protein GIB67_023885, partial [Kingdonia uniflora]